MEAYALGRPPEGVAPDWFMAMNEGRGGPLFGTETALTADNGMDLILTSRAIAIGGARCALRTPRLISVAATVAVVVTSLAAIASAQQYQADKVDDKAAKLGGIAQTMIKDPAKFAADQAEFDDYFGNAYFPAMTRFEADDLAKLGKLRSDLFALYLWATPNEELQKDLTGIAFDKMKVIATKPVYHPAVRYNAVLIIGLLDQQYGSDSGSNKRPPKPLPLANDFLVKLINVGLQGNPIVTPSLVVGALIGLERHAKYHDSLTPPQIEAMTKAAITLAEKDPPFEVDSKVAEWIRIESATVLAKLGTVGQDNKIHDTLIKMLADEKLSLDGRCEVAGLLNLIAYKDAKVDGKVAADKTLQLAVEVGQAEDKRAKDFQELSLSGPGAAVSRGGGRGGYGGAYGGGGGYGGEAHSEYDRKTLLARLGDLKKGMVAIKPVAPADRAAGIDAMTTAMQTLIDAASNKDTTDLDVAEKAVKMFDAIQATAKGGTATAAKPAAEAF